LTAPIATLIMPNEKWASCLAALAALTGAAGVMEAAYAAHGSTDPLIQTSSNFLLFHAAAAIGIAGFVRSTPHKLKLMAAAGFVLLLGTILFCGDLFLRAMTHARLFPFAAPIGGTSMIAGWLGAALAGLLGLRKSA
jgi:uncharacterized membrane protein YgdD (TMEM256/DUF423 family)